MALCPLQSFYGSDRTVLMITRIHMEKLILIGFFTIWTNYISCTVFDGAFKSWLLNIVRNIKRINGYA